jgi:hypothetical protein
MSERETVGELPWAADCCPCVEKLRTVLPFTVGISIRDVVVHLVSTFVRAVISARRVGGREQATGTGGPTATIRFSQELDRERNRGLRAAVRRLEPIKTKFPRVSYADLYQLVRFPE